MVSCVYELAYVYGCIHMYTYTLIQPHKYIQYVSSYVYMYIGMYEFVHMCRHVQIHMYMCVCICMHTLVRIVHICTHTDEYMRTSVYAWTYACISIPMNKFFRVYTYV